MLQFFIKFSSLFKYFTSVVNSVFFLKVKMYLSIYWDMLLVLLNPFSKEEPQHVLYLTFFW